MKYSICISLLILLDVIVAGYIYFWCRKMKRGGYKFCYTAPVWRVIVDVSIIALIISGEIYYFFSGETNMVLIVVMLFLTFVLPPKRYVFLGKQGIYIGRMYFSLNEQLEGQLIKNYPLHGGRVKIYSIHAKQKNSEPVLLSLKKLKVIWKESLCRD